MADEGSRTRGVDGRRRRLLDYLQRETAAQVIELAEHFGVSRMTVHRDLDALSEQGFVRKVHGGARTASLKLVESGFAQRSTVALAEKHAIAREAAGLVQPGQIVALDDSSTATILADELAAIEGLTVITNSLAVLQRLHREPGITVIALGGVFNPHYHGFFGRIAEQAIGSLRANTVFLSAQTVWRNAIWHPDEIIAKNQRALLGIADRRVLLANGQKFGATALHRAASLAEFDVLVTDASIPPAELDRLRQGPLEIVVAEQRA